MRGDRVTYRTGNRFESTKGEVFEDVQDGSKSTVVSGNTRTWASGNSNYHSDRGMLIESLTEMVLKVGDSTITLTPSEIVIRSPKIKLDATGESIKILSSGTVLIKTDGGTSVDLEESDPISNFFLPIGKGS